VTTTPVQVNKGTLALSPNSWFQCLNPYNHCITVMCNFFPS